MTAPVLELADAAAWESWLTEHHDQRPDAWLRIAKRHSDLAVIGIGEALDGALCFGWIDGLRHSLDEVSFLQRYSRRRPRGTWSQVNVGKVDALTAAGRMRPSGLAEVAAARADGRWAAAYAPQRTAEVPSDLRAALHADPRADAAFTALGRTGRYAIVVALLRARTPQGRARTLAREVARLADR